jgi:hypothetical protein
MGIDEERKLIDEAVERTGIDIAGLMTTGLLEKKQLRRWIVREKYFSLAKTGRTYTDIKNELSDEYNVSISMIEKMVYKK